MRSLWMWVLCTALALTACDPRATPAGVAASPTPASTPASTALPTATVVVQDRVTPRERPGSTPDVKADLVIRYERSGGIAGLSEQWTIYGDGRVAAGDGRKGRVEPSDVAAFLQGAESLGFFGMADSYMPKDACCDRFTYAITVYAGKRAHTVKTVEGTRGTPQGLWDILGMLNRLLTESKAAPPLG